MNENDFAMNETLDESQKYYFEEAPVIRSIFHMVLPMLLSMIATLVFNMTDGYFIGMLDNTQMMAAVTLALPISAAQMALGNFFGTGGGTFISRLLGEGNLVKSKTVSATSFYLSLLSGIVFAIIAIWAMPSMLRLVGATQSAWQYTQNYLTVLVLSSPFIIPAFTLEEIVRAEGASKVSMMGMLAGVTFNLILDPIFIFYFKLDIVGAALATVVGNVVMTATYMYYLNSKKSSLSIRMSDFSKEIAILKEMAKTGFSALLMNLFLVAICLIFNQYASPIGDHFIAGFGISQRVVQLADFIGMSFAMGSVPLIAYAYASGNHKRLKALVKTSAGLLLGITAVISLLLIVFSTGVIGLFTKDPIVIEIGQRILMAQLASTLFAGISSLLTGLFQAIGSGVASTIMAAARGVIFIPVIYLGNLMFGMDGVIWSMTTSEIMATAIGIGLLIGLRVKGYFSDSHSKEIVNECL